MKEEEITALAREYAEEIYPHKEFEDIGQMNFLRSIAKNNTTDIIQFILRTHCIVSKEKVAELCRLTFEHDQSVDYGLIDGLTDFVLEVFPEQYHQVIDNPEIGKEVDG